MDQTLERIIKQKRCNQWPWALARIFSLSFLRTMFNKLRKNSKSPLEPNPIKQWCPTLTKCSPHLLEIQCGKDSQVIFFQFFIWKPIQYNTIQFLYLLLHIWFTIYTIAKNMKLKRLSSRHILTD